MLVVSAPGAFGASDVPDDGGNQTDVELGTSPRMYIDVGEGPVRSANVAVWSDPPGMADDRDRHVVGRLRQGMAVTRGECRRARGLNWCRIESDRMAGWVLSAFIRPMLKP